MTGGAGENPFEKGSLPASPFPSENFCLTERGSGKAHTFHGGRGIFGKIFNILKIQPVQIVHDGKTQGCSDPQEHSGPEVAAVFTCLFFKYRLLLAVLTIQKVSNFSSIPPHTGFLWRIYHG